MPKQSKFENVDLFASLNAVMKQNTGFYQSDLEIDKEIIAKAAASPRKEDKTLLWFCRPRPTTHGVSTWSRRATASLPMQSS